MKHQKKKKKITILYLSHAPNFGGKRENAHAGKLNIIFTALTQQMKSIIHITTHEILKLCLLVILLAVLTKETSKV